MTTFPLPLQLFLDWRLADTGGQDPAVDERYQLLVQTFAGDASFHLFDPAWYLRSQGMAQPARGGTKAALSHYVRTGIAGMANPTPWFDETWYREHYPDVRQAIAAGAWRCGYQHYLLRGMGELRSPSPGFNELAYLGSNPDLVPPIQARQLVNGLSHYLLIGRTEGREIRTAVPDRPLDLPLLPRARVAEPSETFADAIYLERHTDVLPVAGKRAGMEHWLSSGMTEDLRGQRPRIEGWVENIYLRRNPDLRPHLGGSGHPTGYDHFLMYGAAEGRAWAGAERERAESALLTAAMARRSPADAWPADQEPPLISVIVPVYDTDLAALRACIESVRTQTYPHWQLCLADDGSTLPAVPEALVAAARADVRITPVFAAGNGGISAASNLALRAARGEYVALLDHDDVLAPDALLHLARAFSSAADVDMVYTDEGKITEDGRLVDLNAKPGWSPEFLLSTMYVGHLTAYRRGLVEQVGGFRSAFDGTQDYDLALRMAEVVRQVVHVPEPLYFWRMSPASSAGDAGAKPDALQRQARALESAVARRGRPGVVRPTHQPGHWAVVLAPPEGAPLVSIVIPTAGRTARMGGAEIDLVVNCVRSLDRSERYPNHEVVLVHNGDLRVETLAQLALLPRVRLVEYRAEPFNLSDKINEGIRAAAGEFVLLLNDDMQAESDDIIGSMLGRMHEGVGLVGGRLLFADGTLQHAGVVWMDEGPTHAMIGEQRLTPGPAERLMVTHDVFAVSGACMFLRRDLFLACGGFPRALPLNYNDVALCLKVRGLGLRIVFNPDVTLFHFESLSKQGTHFWELQRLLLDHPGVTDPYWNANFSRRSPFFELVAPGQVAPDSYRTWLTRRIMARQAGLTASRDIRFSFIVSVYDTSRSQMEELAATVFNQTYANFELVVVDNGSGRAETLAWLETIRSHPQVRFIRLEQNQGIMGGYGAAFRAATGDYVVPVDSDDFLTLDCLHVLATAIEAEGGPDALYSDEDKANEAGETHSPFLKPDWDPVLFSNICFVCHVCAIKRSVAEAVGAYADESAAWCHDWDSFLRLKRAGARISHVPEVLYHWRIHQGSTASIETGTKPRTIDSQRHVLLQDLRLTGQDRFFELAQNEMFPHDGIWRLKPRAAALPGCTVLVCASDRPGRLAGLLGQLMVMPQVAGCSYHVVGTAEQRAELDRVLPEVRRALWPDGDVRTSGSLAEACRSLPGERIVAVVSADVDGLNRSWLAEGIGMFAAAPDVAAVGGQVSTTAGQVVWRAGFAGFGGLVGSPDHGMDLGHSGYYGMSWCQRSCDGVPSLCFFAGAGFLAACLDALPAGAPLRAVCGAVAVRAREAGLRVIYTPFVQVTLDRALPVGPLPLPAEPEAFRSGPAWYARDFGHSVDTVYQLRPG